MNSRTAAAVLTTNPSDGEVLAQYEIMGATEVGGIVRQARLAFEDWKRVVKICHAGICQHQINMVLRTIDPPSSRGIVGT